VTYVNLILRTFLLVGANVINSWKSILHSAGKKWGMDWDWKNTWMA